ncbi:MAG: hypothetical protein Q9211_003698 [Gyalolechia sp. 1 TL-2023]
MDEHEPSPKPPCGQPTDSAAHPFDFLNGDAIRTHSEELEDMDAKDLDPEERQAIYSRVFAMSLAEHGLRSPDYYRDKSQCISFDETAWPAEIALYKAQMLRRGYIEPEELTRRLNKLKPSDNFTLRKYRHRQMEWEKSPIPRTPYVVPPPRAEWCDDQVFYISRMRRRLGERLMLKYGDDACDYWDKICHIDLTPLPDLYLLKHIGHSASGTLFPRYLVKGLHELRERANKRGSKYYDQEYEKAKVKRSDAIQRWQDENPDSVLAKDTLSIYRTWPAELMAQLSALDQEAMRCGSRRYMADLLETEKEMQKLVSFWRDCGLITGIRTPLSPQWPDPKAKLRGLHWPDYLKQRREAIHKEFGFSVEGTRKETIEFARWKEAVLNTDCDPLTSEMPLSDSLLNELDIAWQGYENFLDREDVEDEMIAKIGQWRKSKLANPSSDRTHLSHLNSGIGAEEMTDKTRSDAPHQESSSHEIEKTTANQECIIQRVAQPPSIATVKIYRSIPGLSRSDSMALEEAAHFLQERSRKGRRPRNPRARLTADDTTWSGRLRPKRGPENVSRQQVRRQRKPSERPQGVVKHGGRGQLRLKSPMAESTTWKPLSSNIPSPQYPVDVVPLQTVPRSTKMKEIRKAQTPLSKPQGVRKLRKPKCNPSISHGLQQDKRAHELFTPSYPT